MGGLEVVQVLLVDADGFLELFDVLGAAFAEGGLRLSVALLALFGRRIDGLAPALALDGLVVLGTIAVAAVGAAGGRGIALSAGV